MKILEISKDNLRHNINLIKNKIAKETPDVKVYAVVKSNGVGLGLVEYTKFLIENGINSFAVARFEEAIDLRKAEVENEI